MYYQTISAIYDCEYKYLESFIMHLNQTRAKFYSTSTNMFFTDYNHDWELRFLKKSNVINLLRILYLTKAYSLLLSTTKFQ